MSTVYETTYQIPFNNRDEFERIWPILLGLKSQGAPITLFNVDENFDGDLAEWSNSQPLVRIRAPYRGGFGSLVDGPPWPDFLRNDKRELPEFVHPKKVDGTLTMGSGKG